MAIQAVVFDMDGVLLDSEQIWDHVRRELTRELGGTWGPDSQRRMMGMSSVEWSQFMADELRVPLTPEQISKEVVVRIASRYQQGVPVLPGAIEAVKSLAGQWPLAIASSSNRPIIDMALEQTGLDEFFITTVSSEEVAQGKPNPDVYLEAASRLGVPATACVGVEDSANGMRAVHAAGMQLIAFANPHYPPSADALALADVEIHTMLDLDVELVGSLARVP